MGHSRGHSRIDALRMTILLMFAFFIIIGIVGSVQQAIARSNILRGTVNRLELDTGIVRVGDELRFGEYDWYVLALYKDNSVLIITANELSEPRAFNDTQKKVSWQDSDLRKYLNTDFLKTFSEEQREYILTTSVRNSGMAKKTNDSIYLLNNYETITLFTGINADRGGSGWWQRTPAKKIVDFDSLGFASIRMNRASSEEVRTGRYSSANVHRHMGVRPAMRIDVNEFPLPPCSYVLWNDEIKLVGDTIKFDGYEWLILNMDERNNSVLLITKNSVETRQFTGLEDYLNRTFINNFSQEYRSRILEQRGRSGRVFLIDSSDVERYFHGVIPRSSQESSWWLNDGLLYGGSRSIGSGEYGVRPAIVFSIDVDVR